ncbi:MAG: IS5 family transposase [Acidobacteria bacterium]|nr:MAG: IS5 family transposase [Acidobacteriota bacterium]
MKQRTFADLEYDAKKRTRREQFLDEMDRVIPWARWVALIEPHYPKAGLGRRPMPLERMLRIHLLQQWFNLSDPAMEEMLIDSQSMRRFAGINLMDDPVPDETTILKFRHLLEANALAEKLFRDVGMLLTARGLMLHKGTIVDATIINAPPSTKNRDRARDPDMSQVKKRNTWHFGMKAHIGVDLDTGLVHTLVTTTGRESDQNMLPQLLHGEENEVLGDRGYGSKGDRALAREAGIELRTAHRTTRGKELTFQQGLENKVIASLRAIVEFPFRVVKRQWGHVMVRYRGLAKNTAQLHMLFALSNLYQARARLLPT